MFFDMVKVHIFWKFIQYTTHWHKIQMLQKFQSLQKIHSFSFRELQLISFTSDSPFLYELKHKGRLSKNVSGTFHFRFCFVFIKVYIFLPQKNRLFDFETS